MKQNKIAPLNAANIQRGRKKITLPRAVPSSSYYNTERIDIATVLSSGQHNAKTMSELQELTGLSVTTIKAYIDEERENGLPVLSGQAGYWLPKNGKEVRQCCEEMRKKAQAICHTADLIENAARGYL